MIPTLREMNYEKGMEKLKLFYGKGKRERGLKSMFKVMNGLEQVDWVNLLMRSDRKRA